MTLTREKHPLWKGDNVGYQGAHAWLRRYYTKIHCQFCDSEKNLQWAKKKGSTYTRNVEDYMVLCTSCHRKYDMEGKTIWNKGNVTVYLKECEFCRKNFDAVKKSRRFCSNKCSSLSRHIALHTK